MFANTVTFPVARGPQGPSRTRGTGPRRKAVGGGGVRGTEPAAAGDIALRKALCRPWWGFFRDKRSRIPALPRWATLWRPFRALLTPTPIGHQMVIQPAGLSQDRSYAIIYGQCAKASLPSTTPGAAFWSLPWVMSILALNTYRNMRKVLTSSSKRFAESCRYRRGRASG